MMRSKLFVPAIRPELFHKALRSGADAVCLDLEDAVAADQKATARSHIQAFLSHHNTAGPRLMVRVNHVSSSFFLADLDASVWPSLFAITLPKVESPEDIHIAQEAIATLESEHAITTPIGILPTIESARGLRVAAEIAQASPRVIGLQIGFADLLEPLDISPANLMARNHIRLMVRLAASEADLDCFDSAFPDFKDDDAFRLHLEAARSFGFAGCSCIHPAQIPLANAAFTPSPQSLAHARRVLEAAAEAARRGAAVTTLDGKMIDRPFLLAAERLLRRSLS